MTVRAYLENFKTILNIRKIKTFASIIITFQNLRGQVINATASAAVNETFYNFFLKKLTYINYSYAHFKVEYNWELSNFHDDITSRTVECWIQKMTSGEKLRSKDHAIISFREGKNYSHNLKN